MTMKLTEKQLRKLVNEELESSVVLPADVADYVREVLTNIAAHVERLKKAKKIHKSDVEYCSNYLMKRSVLLNTILRDSLT